MLFLLKFSMTFFYGWVFFKMHNPQTFSFKHISCIFIIKSLDFNDILLSHSYIICSSNTVIGGKKRPQKSWNANNLSNGFGVCSLYNACFFAMTEGKLRASKYFSQKLQHVFNVYQNMNCRREEVRKVKKDTVIIGRGEYARVEKIKNWFRSIFFVHDIIK